MKKKRSFLIWIILLLGMIISYLSYHAYFNQGGKITYNNVQKYNLAQLERLVLETEDPTGENRELIIREMDKKAKELIWLIIDGREYSPTAIYYGHELEDDFRCNLMWADDTIHITEFPEQVEFIPVKSNTKIFFASRFDEDTLQFYLGDPLEMHRSGYQHIKQATKEGNRLLFGGQNFKNSKILFTIIKGKNDLLYKKFVWVLGKNSLPNKKRFKNTISFFE